MAKLFLSYSRKDAAKAQRFTQWLEREGHHVWRDDDDICGGASFSSEIEKALNDCDAVLVLWSAQSVQSAWVRDEAGYGRDAAKLIPFSVDGTAPPLGFRQFQSIDLSKWKGHGEPSTAERIRRAIGRLSASPAPADAAASVSAAAKWSRTSPRTIAAFLLLVLAASVGVFLWHNASANQKMTIAILPSPASADRAAAADYANVTAADMAAFLPKHFDRATVIAPADAVGRTSGYRMLVSANRHGSAADASVTLSDLDGQTIIWSKSWSVPDSSAVDLAQMISRFASQAALCLTQARGGDRRIDQPTLGLFVSTYAAIGDSQSSDAELLAGFERIVKLAPDFPPGWAYLSVGRSIFAAGQKSGPRSAYIEALKQARVAISTARQMNPSSGLPYLAEALLAPLDHVRGLALLDKAAELEPDNGIIVMNRAGALSSVGRMADSVEVAHRSIELDPLSPFTRSSYIQTLTDAGEFAQAQADITEARKKWLNDYQIDLAEFHFQYRYGDARAAEKMMTRVFDYSEAQLAPYRKIIAARLDPTPAKIDAAIGAFREAQSGNPNDPNQELLALALFGKVEDIYRLLGDQAFQPHVDMGLLFRPEFASVRADPRFMQVTARVGLVRYWRTNGNWPDFCTTEKLKYDCKTEAAKYV